MPRLYVHMRDHCQMSLSARARCLVKRVPRKSGVLHRNIHPQHMAESVPGRNRNNQMLRLRSNQIMFRLRSSDGVHRWAVMQRTRLPDLYIDVPPSLRALPIYRVRRNLRGLTTCGDIRGTKMHLYSFLFSFLFF